MTQEQTESLERFVEAVRADPLDESLRLVFSDWCEENEYPKQAAILRAGRIPVTGIDTAVAYQLAHATFLPGSYDKPINASPRTSLPFCKQASRCP